MRTIRKHTRLPLLLLFLAAPAMAEISVDISGFGTAGVAWADTNDAQYIRAGMPEGVDSRGDIGLDSLAGLQATVHFTEVFSATVQTMVRRKFAKDLLLDVNLAFVKAKLTDSLALRVGRIAFPVFMVSDFRQVGYANTWIRPPVEVYGQLNSDNIDGVDLYYNTNVGPVSLTMQALYGKADVLFNFSGLTASLTKIKGANVTATIGPLSLRAARIESKITLVPLTPNATVANVRNAGYIALADSLLAVDAEYAFTSLGFILDWKNIIVQGEGGRRTFGGSSTDNTGRYVMAGYRVNKFTPYVIYSWLEIDNRRFDNVIPRVGAGIALANSVDVLIRGNEQNSKAVGLRWDVGESLALKFQLDRVDPERTGMFTRANASFKGPVLVAGVALDFIF